MKKTLLAIILGIALAGPAQAETGEKIAVVCDASPDTCDWYVAGVVDTAGSFSWGHDVPSVVRCIPEGATYSQLGAVFRRYLDTHPEQLHLRAQILVLESVGDAFPCEEGKP